MGKLRAFEYYLSSLEAYYFTTLTTDSYTLGLLVEDSGAVLFDNATIQVSVTFEGQVRFMTRLWWK